MTRPWRTVEYGYEKHSITDDRGVEIGFAHRRHDARLIAAAPELYEALVEARRFVNLGTIDADQETQDEARMLLSDLDAALAKASAPYSPRLTQQGSGGVDANSNWPVRRRCDRPD